jgi:xylulokinase
MSDYFIGIDSGTQSTKALILHGRDGKIMGSASVPYGMIGGLPAGAKEQHPKTWVEAMEKSIQQALVSSKIPSNQIKGIGVSGQQHGLVALDEKDQVIRPAKLWCDTTTAGQAALITKKLGGLKKVIALTGSGIPAGFTASKILWLKQNESKNYHRMRTVLLPHDYLNFHLTGRKTMEAGDASGTGLLDTKTRNWQSKVIAALDPSLAERLPAIQQSSELAGMLRPELAKKLGLSPDVIVSSGGGDNMMGAIGTGNVMPGVVTASLGTSGTLCAYSSRPVIDPNGELASFCDSTGAWLPLVCTMNVTVATELLKKMFAWDNQKLSQAVEKVSAGSDGLLLLPYLEGERVPNLPDASGVFFGLNTKNFTQPHMARATMEGVALGLNYGLNRMVDLGIRPKQIRVTGGGSQNAVWRQILADVFEAEVVGLMNVEGAAYGAAVQAKWAYSLQRGERIRLQQITDAFIKTDPSTRAHPVKVHSKKYRTLQSLHNAVSKANAGVFSAHATALR